VRRALILLLVLMIGGRPSLEARAKAEAIARIPRASYRVPGPGEVTMSFLHAGTAGGRLVIFVHGSPGSAEAWSDYLLQVPAGFEYVAVDRLGFGRSAPGVAEPSLVRQAGAIAPLLRRAPHPILVGHSLGGPIVAELAADYPEEVGGVIILAGALDPAMEKIKWYNRVADWPVVRTILPRELTTSNRELRPLKGELERLAPKLDRITAPIIIVHGERDQLVPVENVRYMRPRFAAARSVRTVLLPRENHFLPWTQKPLIDRLIRELGS
jgi:pimeloyl-ACP methyl ester carboxylesterase